MQKFTIILAVGVILLGLPEYGPFHFFKTKAHSTSDSSHSLITSLDPGDTCGAVVTSTTTTRWHSGLWLWVLQGYKATSHVDVQIATAPGVTCEVEGSGTIDIEFSVGCLGFTPIRDCAVGLTEVVDEAVASLREQIDTSIEQSVMEKQGRDASAG